MKAEERKENETNKLRVWAARQWAKLEGRTLYILGGSVLLCAAVGLIIWFWLSSRDAAKSARTLDLKAAADADSPETYDKLILTSDKHKGHATIAFAKYMKARRIMYGDGLEKLSTTDREQRKNAATRIEEGRNLFEQVANDLKDYPVLQQDAWMSCAKAEETLLGFPKDGGGYRGNYDKMIDFMKKAASINPDSEVSKGYDQLAKARSDPAKQEELLNFYRQLYE